MKTFKTILVGTLLTSVMSFANTAKVNEPTKKIYQVLQGDSVDSDKKSGLAIDLKYKSQHVDVGESSDVNITLTTGLKEGTLNVKLRALDNQLEGIGKEDITFNLLNSKSNSFPINLEVSSEEEGIHYINVDLSVEGQGARVFAVPVYIGTVANKIENKAIEKTEEGAAISISNAEEEIK